MVRCSGSVDKTLIRCVEELFYVFVLSEVKYCCQTKQLLFDRLTPSLNNCH